MPHQDKFIADLDRTMERLAAHSGAFQRREIVRRFAVTIARAQRDFCAMHFENHDNDIRSTILVTDRVKESQSG